MRLSAGDRVALTLHPLTCAACSMCQNAQHACFFGQLLEYAATKCSGVTLVFQDSNGNDTSDDASTGNTPYTDETLGARDTKNTAWQTRRITKQLAVTRQRSELAKTDHLPFLPLRAFANLRTASSLCSAVDAKHVPRIRSRHSHTLLGRLVKAGVLPFQPLATLQQKGKGGQNKAWTPNLRI